MMSNFFIHKTEVKSVNKFFIIKNPLLIAKIYALCYNDFMRNDKKLTIIAKQVKHKVFN